MMNYVEVKRRQLGRRVRTESEDETKYDEVNINVPNFLEVEEEKKKEAEQYLIIEYLDEDSNTDDEEEEEEEIDLYNESPCLGVDNFVLSEIERLSGNNRENCDVLGLSALNKTRRKIMPEPSWITRRRKKSIGEKLKSIFICLP